ncbi:MAG: hypothetical protein OHK0032_06710 [Thermodesulfovibrionales bacterium]
MGTPSSAFSLQPIFHAWWPSQFIVNDRSVRILATFGESLPDSYSSDLNIGDVRKNGNWKELEELYGINLDPERLKDEPAVVEGRYGDGKVLLSLIHFDTPEDEKGAGVLRNVWRYYGCHYAIAPGRENSGFRGQNSMRGLELNNHCSTLLHCCSEIIDFGVRNFLWFWRTPMLLQWRRGVRGLEYNTLYVMVKEIAEIGQQSSSSVICENNHSLENYCSAFKEKALRLLMLEGSSIQKGSKIDSYSIGEHLEPEIKALRQELFGNAKSHGGLFKEILDKIDHILFRSLKEATIGS